LVLFRLIRPEVASDRDTIERFSNEIRLSRRIGRGDHASPIFGPGTRPGIRDFRGIPTRRLADEEDKDGINDLGGAPFLGGYPLVGSGRQEAFISCND